MSSNKQSKPVSNSRGKGSIFEKIALNFLLWKGYKLLEKNFTVRGGEIDLVMDDGEMVVFIEVKSRNIFTEYSIYSTLTKFKKRILKRTIGKWLLKNQRQNSDWRLDVVAIEFGKTSEYNIEHFEFIQLN